MSEKNNNKKKENNYGFFDLKKVIKDIKKLKIQGAEKIAKASITALAKFLHHNSVSDSELYDILMDFINARPTEPALRNSIRLFILLGGHEHPLSTAKKINDYFFNAENKIAEIVNNNLLRNNGVYFTHCHSSTVIKALTFDINKKITIMNTETRPLFQGRITAKELALKGRKVIHGIDNSALYFIKEAEAVFLGADAILRDGSVINKIGSNIIAQLAHNNHVPVYILSTGLKLSDKNQQGEAEYIEERAPEEVWDLKNDFKKNINIFNPAFEIVEEKYITAIISELGIFKPKIFVKKAMKKYDFIKKSI